MTHEHRGARWPAGFVCALAAPALVSGDRWGAVAAALTEALDVLGARGGGTLTLAVRRRPGHVTCHVTSGLVVGEAAGNAALGDGQWLTPGDVDALVALGWLPPGERSTHWQRRWERVEGPAGVARELLALVRRVYRASPDQVVLALGACDLPSCAVHARQSAPLEVRVGVGAR